ncbi:MAG TPA: hypothetical protein VK730_00670 [Solirubrobacteraceae bacterium]|jgi:hypothetical protein|nr:hypothetical protein [Solirubrobacteraceae bacterium]
MKQIHKTGPFTVAVLAVVALMSTVVVASASAALPEYKATKLSITFTFQNASGVEPVIASYVPELGSDRNIVCKASQGKGEFAGFKGEVYKHLVFSYTGCREQGVTPERKCTSSGHSAGEIVTQRLKGEIGYAEGSSRKNVGLELKPESGSVLAEFTCAGEAEEVTLEGCTVGEATPLNVSQKTGVLAFEEGTSHKQKWTKLEGKSGGCELKITAAFFKLGKGTSWIMDNELETFSENVELKA